MITANKKISILSVNISKKKASIKYPAAKIVLNKKGIKNDAHSGAWHGQVSLLSKESIDKFSKKINRKIQNGEFAENITISGIDIRKTSIGDVFQTKDVKLELIQKGKKCHGDTCAIFHKASSCIMLKQGIFCRVISGGELKAGDVLEYFPNTIKTKIITLSDRAFNKQYKDKSGIKIENMLKKYFNLSHWSIETERILIPDNAKKLRTLLLSTIDSKRRIVITTGGTGIGKKDITPDVIKPMLEKEIPGIMEHIRLKYCEKIPSALLSRSIAGTINNTLIYTLPGSLKAVKEYMTEILKTLEHCLYTIADIDIH
ncbi:MAG: hypothetical protein B6I26_05095 [Desulfobacteraceae bacterium 4572_130]|nr:MAG: hypothetical protein B6I26_05095 [Desulfobacteraceae bacterium 4572_130]